MPLVLKLSRKSLSEQVSSAATILQEGGLVALPTDTLYGLAGLAQNNEAIKEIYRVKKRNRLKPVAVCVAYIADVYEWAKVTVPEALLHELLPGPVTLIFKRSTALNKHLNPETELVGIRIPNSTFIRQLTIACGAPLALTSANISTKQSPLAVEEFKEIWHEVSCVYDGGVISRENVDRLSGCLSVLNGDSFSVNNNDLKYNGIEKPCIREGSTIVNLSEKGYYSIVRNGVALHDTLELLHKYELKPAL